MHEESLFFEGVGEVPWMDLGGGKEVKGRLSRKREVYVARLVIRKRDRELGAKIVSKSERESKNFDWR